MRVPTVRPFSHPPCYSFSLLLSFIIISIVSFHGSWDRQPPTGYKVVAAPGSVASSGAWSPTAPLTSRTGFTDLLWNSDTTRCPTSCFRPVGLVFAAAGSLYVSSDASGEIFLVRSLSPGTTTTPTTQPTSSTSRTSTTPSPTSTAGLVPRYGQCNLFILMFRSWTDIYSRWRPRLDRWNCTFLLPVDWPHADIPCV